jgi:hypothetical protein
MYCSTAVGLASALTAPNLMMTPGTATRNARPAGIVSPTLSGGEPPSKCAPIVSRTCTSHPAFATRFGHLVTTTMAGGW